MKRTLDQLLSAVTYEFGAEDKATLIRAAKALDFGGCKDALVEMARASRRLWLVAALVRNPNLDRETAQELAAGTNGASKHLTQNPAALLWTLEDSERRRIANEQDAQAFVDSFFNS